MKHFITGISMVVALFFSATSFATENFPGVGCEKILTSGNAEYNGDGSIQNSGNTPFEVTCLVPHTDFNGTFHTGAIEQAHVFVYDGNAEASNADIWCEVLSYSMYGNITLLGKSGRNSSKNIGAQTITLNAINKQDINSFYSLNCRLPRVDPAYKRKSLIYGYRIDQ
jgi:hypothetical protein